MSWKSIIKAAAAAAFLLVHTFLAALFIVCVYGVEKLIAALWGVQEPLLFGRVPLAYAFHAIDLGVLGVFGFRGIVAANEAFKDGRGRRNAAEMANAGMGVG